MNLNPIDPKLIVLAATVILVIAVLAWLYVRKRRNTTAGLRQRFGPEYERAVREQGSERKAESKLTDREKRVEKLDIRDLNPLERERFSEQWKSIQSRFVDSPKGAVTEADDLVSSLMKTRGYPVSDFDQRAGDISVDHPRVVENYRSAHEIAMRVGKDKATTEDLRTAMIHYRSLFEELVQVPTTVKQRRVFITGSSDGLGRMAAQLIIERGHQVVLHARNERRGEEALAAVPGAETVVIGDLSSIAQTCSVAEQVNRLGSFDAVIHNAAVGDREPRRIATEDGLAHVFAVNTLGPYILTALIQRPKRLVYLSSSLHQIGDPTLNDLMWDRRPWQGKQAYADTKLHDVLLAFAVARRWPNVYSNALEPGWVATKMGGPGARDVLDAGHRTQVWLATSDDHAAMVTGEYFFHMRLRAPNPAARDLERQEKLLEACKQFSGVELPQIDAFPGGHSARRYGVAS
jgi:NAD(P)-dependent dehydrogenase (short-subunit alcohol dehydrogenase family)